MNLLAVFGIDLAASALMLTAALAWLLRPLGAALNELCGSRERGEFWTVLSGVAIAAGSLLLGLLGFSWGQVSSTGVIPPHSSQGETQFWSSVQMVRGTAAGVLLGLAVLARLVLAFTARLADRSGCPPAQTPG
jgi:hypothetical protein